MSGIKIGDIVARKSYGYDVLFKVTGEKCLAAEDREKILTIKGLSYRLVADAPESDLELQTENKISEYLDKCIAL